MFKPIELPYPLDALEMLMSKENLETHYEKHYKGYVKKVNELSKRTDKYSELDKLVKDSYTSDPEMFNMSAQALNHEFFWRSMTPEQTKSSFRLMRKIEKDFGSLKNLKDVFNVEGANHFGSGWVWLVYNIKYDVLRVMSTHDAGTPITIGEYYPILVCDLWEHSYYLTWKNDRSAYLKNFWSVVNWDFVSENYEKALDQALVKNLGNMK